MESFSLFYEKFSLNPFNWFRRELSEIDIKMREEARKNAVQSLSKLKQVLKERGYIIHKHDYAYTIRKDKKLALSPQESRGDKMKYKHPINNINYMRALFSLAHEVGHVLQWNEETNVKERFEEFSNKILDLQDIKDHNGVKAIKHLYTMYYELDAWVKGLAFIPPPYRNAYEQYAYVSYKTYMVKSKKSYYNDPLLKELFIQLNDRNIKK